MRQPCPSAMNGGSKGCDFGMIAVFPNKRMLGFDRFLSHFGDSHG
jgi:hypothetical protein